ncbi:uncharacterized protein B0I36DRAFT_323287 [Microdochium trichocladiopsis]|uniref:Nucleoside phosphorylase domain-containing protein n=1 Tax=Microdochium trichocladiopsis TaxID=1682393 RepID=A0A9P8Y4Q4_9PEZI|nr:uncharacterized protein B0I36DRAFT_323287 [Microdochium trichocladiopsis]KAH7031147.1 hypothetical protein B0I36DRAFT_323287 [Microdochium trichocladiopsis]
MAMKRPWTSLDDASAESGHSALPASDGTAMTHPAERTSNGLGSTLSHRDYTIAWICALPVELATSRLMLDDEHGTLDALDADDNSYVFGRVADHNVVMAVLPGVYGKVNAAGVAKDLKRTFPNIRATLMVGIGGGAPGEADLYLGDVVVGTRVMEYDLGKAMENGGFEVTGIPKQPSPLLLATVTNLRSKHEHDQWSSRALALLQTRLSRFPRPTQPDQLFQASYPHPPGANTCQQCDLSRLQPRRQRLGDSFQIHYGGVASGDSVNKDARKRDTVARKLDIKCFEMESAGIMDSLACLPIRGICDYSDSHKNKVWQPYAAATAASYARELLENIPPLATTRQSPSLATEKPATSGSISRTVHQRKDILKLLEFPRMNSRKSAIQAEQSKTCRWFLAHPKYARWAGQNGHDSYRSSFLWMRGKAGTGKSTMMRFLDLEARKRHSDIVISYFFNARGELVEKSITGMYRSLLSQLLTLAQNLQHVLDGLELPLTGEHFKPDLQTLKTVFQEAIMMLGRRRLVCFIDALDECDENDVRDMVQFLDDLTESTTEAGIHFRVAFSSRPYPYIQVDEDHLITLENEEGHAADLVQYVAKRLRVPKKTHAELEHLILAMASGVFMWVVLVVEILNKEASRGGLALRRRLSEIPPTLSQLFKEILTRDQERPEQLRRCILWVLCANRPLTPSEFCHAMWAGGLSSSEVDDEELPDTEDQELNVALATSASKGLVEVIRVRNKQTSVVQFIHESVSDYLVKERGLQELWPDLGFEWEGPSHEILRACCESYLNHPRILEIIKGYSGMGTDYDNGQPAFVTDEWTRFVLTVIERHSPDNPSFEAALAKGYRFLQYATQNILYHADRAALYTPQHSFLARFFGRLGAPALDCCQPVKNRRYGDRADGVHVLVDKTLYNLISTCTINYALLDRKRQLGEEAHHYLCHSDSLIVEAASNGNKRLVAALLGLPSSIYQGKDLLEGLDGAMNVARISPASWAAEEGRIELLEVLARNAYSLSRVDQPGYTPISRAARNGHTKTVRFLVEHGVSVASTDSFGCTPLLRAAESGRTATVQLLLDLGAAVNDESYNEAVRWSIIRGHGNAAMVLLRRCRAWNKMPVEDWTRLAERFGHAEVAQLIDERSTQSAVSRQLRLEAAQNRRRIASAAAQPQPQPP